MQTQVCILVIVLILSFLVLQPPLVQAIFSGDPEEIRMLIHKTEDVNALVRDCGCCMGPPVGQARPLDIFCAVNPCRKL